jgi:thiol-disulfide isomerase/thioredoxin
MNNDTYLRIFEAAAIIGVGVTLWVLVNRWILIRARKNSPGLETIGTRSILYFTTPTCAPCKTFQRPAIERVQQVLGDCLKVIEIDASTQPELASQWGVLSVPTTFILDAKGQPRHINHGPTSAEKLLKQLEILSSNGV